MRFVTVEECSDSELHCIYHDPERTITLFHPRTACSLHFYAPEEDHRSLIGVFHTRRPNHVHSWWLQRLGIAGNRLLGVTRSFLRETIATVQQSGPDESHRQVVKQHLTNLRSVIPHHDALDEEEFIHNVQPLHSPWSWPSNAYYREARRGYTARLTEPLIADLITNGLLLANEIGIRWKHMDQYILLRIEEPVCQSGDQPRIEQLDTPAFRHAAIWRCCVDDGNAVVDDKSPGTPIVEVDNSLLQAGEKKVRLSAKRTCVQLSGDEQIRRVEDVEDNEGKTEMKRLGSKKRKTQRTRMRLCWDSDRGF